jgi:hypothetical protein
MEGGTAPVEVIMKFIVDAGFPLEPFNTLCPLGHSREKLGELPGAIKPEVIYIIDSGARRGAVLADPGSAGPGFAGDRAV